MKEQNWIDRFIYWFFEKLERYDCSKNRHRWVYTLSESGIVYRDDKDVPPELWKCMNCGVKKQDFLQAKEMIK